MSKRTRRRLALAVMWVWLGVVAGCRGTDPTWQAIQTTGEIRVGIDPTYPPFAVSGDGGYAGIDIALIEALAAVWEVDVVFKPLAYDALYAALESGQVDLLAAGLPVESYRLETVAYSEPYFNAGQVLVVPRGSAVARVADLGEAVVAVELGSRGHVAASAAQQNHSDMQITSYSDVQTALDTVGSEADAAIVDAISARTVDTAGLMVAGEPVTVEPLALAVRRDSPQLLRAIDESLVAWGESGRLDGIIDANWR